MNKANHIDQGRVRQLLKYDPTTGIFTWNVDKGRVKKGAQTGSLLAAGYLLIGIDGKRYLAHRLAWVYMYGENPDYIDHVNHVRNDNRIGNLRSVSRLGNERNISMYSNNTSGINGVGRNKVLKKWYASIRVDGVQLHLGYYFDIADAIKARKAA